MTAHSPPLRPPVRHAASTDRESDSRFRIGPHVMVGTTLAFLLVLGCGGWAASAHLNGAIIAQGTVKVDQNLKEVQHRDGGIIQSLMVRQGDSVREGQVLLRLDDVQLRAELAIIRSQMGENLARRARLRAERDNLATLAFPPELESGSAELRQFVAGEARLFAGNRANRESRKEQLSISIFQLGEEIKGLQARKVAKVEELKLVQMEREKFLELFSRGLIDGTRVYTVNREWARLLGERGEIEASLARANLRISEFRLQILAVDDTAQTEAQRELQQVEARIAELGERLVATEDRLSRTEIRSPIDGLVNELHVFTVGGVISPAARLATIVPSDAKLTIETRLAPLDIDQIKVGQAARLRFPAFNKNTTPEFPGTISHVSPATTRDPANGTVFYTGEVRIDGGIAAVGERQLVPGMPVEVFILTEERTAMSYVLKPFMDHVARVFREK